LPKKTLLNDVWIQQKRISFPFVFLPFTTNISLSAEDVIKRLEEEHAAAVRQVKELEESLERLTDAKHELFVHLKSSLREEEKRKEEEKQRVLAAQQQFFAQQQQQYQQYLQQLQQQQQQQH
jgi:hypothetical protein